jgi:hypothetical protein
MEENWEEFKCEVDSNKPPHHPSRDRQGAGY